MLPCAKNKFGFYLEDVVALGWWVGCGYKGILWIEVYFYLYGVDKSLT